MKKKIYYGEELYHHGIKGQKWGVRRFQNEDGTLTEKGKKRYSTYEEMERFYNKTMMPQAGKTIKGNKHNKWHPHTSAEKSIKRDRANANNLINNGNNRLYGSTGAGLIRGANMSDITDEELELALYALLGIDVSNEMLLFDDETSYFKKVNAYTTKNHNSLSEGVAEWVIKHRYDAIEKKATRYMDYMRKNQNKAFTTSEIKKLYKNFAEEMYPKK